MSTIDYVALLKPEKLVFPKSVKGKIRRHEEHVDGVVRDIWIDNPNGYKGFPPGTLESIHYTEDGTVESLERTRTESPVDPTLYSYLFTTNGETKIGQFSFSIMGGKFTMEDRVYLDTNSILQRRYLYNGNPCTYKGLPAISTYDKKTGQLTEETWQIQKKSGRWYSTSITHRPVAEGPAIIRYKDGKNIEQVFMENGRVRKDPAAVKAAVRKKRPITAGQVAEWISSQPENISKLNEVLDVALKVGVEVKR
jgi:hypothetical protein